MKKNRVLFLLFLLNFAIVFLSGYFHLRINHTPSMPKGLYRTTQNPITRDSWVEVCLSEKLSQFGFARHYLQAGTCPDGVEPTFKKVVGIAGDTVDVRPYYVAINGMPLPHSATFLTDGNGRLLPSIARGRFILSADNVWLYGQASSRSWDSRYYGAVDKSHIVAVVKPIFRW